MYSGVDTFLIYRDTANNNYAIIGKVPYDSLSLFNDTLKSLYHANGDPNVSSWRYKIAIKDSCGNIGAKSPYHQTMAFQENTNNFNWSQYQIEGQTIPVPILQNYLFLRDDFSTGVWNNIQTLSASSMSYTDPNYSSFSSTGNWRVETLWNIDCTPTYKLNSNNAIQTTITKSRSNIRNNRTSNIKQLSIYKNVYNVYPIPASNEITITSSIELKNCTLEIIDATGRVVNAERIINNGKKQLLNVSYLQNGIYTLRINSGDEVVVKKIVVEK